MSETQDLSGRPSRARYDLVHAVLERRWRRRRLEAERMMREVVDELWNAFGGSPYSWCGFCVGGGAGEGLVLGPRWDKVPSTVPLGGVCGKVFKTGLAVNVPDVKALDPDFQGRNPECLSKIALPVFDRQGRVWAVFEAESRSPAAFDEMDKRWLERILKNFRGTSSRSEAKNAAPRGEPGGGRDAG